VTQNASQKSSGGGAKIRKFGNKVGGRERGRRGKVTERAEGACVMAVGGWTPLPTGQGGGRGGMREGREEGGGRKKDLVEGP